MKKAWVLSKLYINSLYGFSGFLSDLKVNRKAAIKKIGFIVLLAVAFSGTIAMFVGFNIKMFDLLKSVNQQGIIISLMIIVASLLTFVFGMIGIITTYFVDKEGDLILSMPIKAWQILLAKYASNYVYEAILSLIIMATGFMVYGIKSGSGPLFYVISVIISAFIPFIPLTIGYFIVIPLMRAGSILRKKDFTMIMTGVIAIIFGVGIQYLSQSMIKVDSNPAAMMLRLMSPDGMIAVAGKIYYPSVWATYSITKYSSMQGVVNLLIFGSISLLIIALLITSMSSVYSTSIASGQEVSKSRKYTEGEFKKNIRRKGVFSTLLTREIRLMNREPIYFLNGPLVILIMPIIIGVMLYLQRGEISKGLESLSKLTNADYYITLAAAGISVFLGVSVNITSTCISREGKTFELLKSMPIEPKNYLKAKLLHGMIFGALASLMCIIIAMVIGKLGAVNLVLIFIISMVVMLPIQILGIIIELTWPKLIWDNPQKAMKQNMNGVIIILATMVTVPLLGFIIFKFISAPLYAYTALIIIPALVSIALYSFLMKFGSKRYYEIET